MTNVKLLPRSCPLCKKDYNSKSFRRLFEQRFEALGRNYVISQCRRCGLIHQNPAYNNDFYLSLYDFFSGLYSNLAYGQTNYKYHPDKIKRYKSVASIIGSLSSFSPGTQILDFGCHDGAFITWVQENADWASNVEFVGYDIYLKGLPKGRNFYNSLDKLLSASEKFDFIVLNYVLEHILDPLELLSFLSASLLKEGGRLVIEVPNISFLMNNDFMAFRVQHTNYFTPETMTKLINAAGLALENLHTFKNYDVGREPYDPSLLAIGQKDTEYLKDSKSLERTITLQRKQLKDKIGRLGKGVSLGIVGCGDALFLISGFLKKVKLTGLFDNNKKLWGTEILGHKVQPIEEVKNCNCDAILVCAVYKLSSQQIVKQLSQYVSLDKVITFFD